MICQLKHGKFRELTIAGDTANETNQQCCTGCKQLRKCETMASHGIALHLCPAVSGQGYFLFEQ
jgi:hypothetical protein